MPGTRHAGVTAAAPLPVQAPVPLLFLISDTGGGHRSAAVAVSQALDREYPGQFAPLLCDPLTGPGSARLLRLVAGLYGPAIRLAPWLWGAAYHACDSAAGAALLRWSLLWRASGPALAAARAHRPAVVVSFHPLTGWAAVACRRALGCAAVTVITDLATVHATWRAAAVDLLIGPGGPPVASQFWAGPAGRAERDQARGSLGLGPAGPGRAGLLIVLAGGGEGSGAIAAQATAILRRFSDVRVVAICGRNQRLRGRLDGLAARAGGALTVLGFTPDMASWLRCADLVVTKAGPGAIAEAACCGTPLLLTSQLPGQERGNIEVVTGAGAGRRVRGLSGLLAEIARLRADPAALAAMRTAAARLARPARAATIAAQIAHHALPGGPRGVGGWSSTPHKSTARAERIASGGSGGRMPPSYPRSATPGLVPGRADRVGGCGGRVFMPPTQAQ
ncbi:MAG TPA: glycosyltransferase [Streptosporangiaceae bacterium]|jgi:1,2-diacylglycerol 3-beta-galactosyltransferase